jgi:hypothetical protein
MVDVFAGSILTLGSVALILLLVNLIRILWEMLWNEG